MHRAALSVVIVAVVLLGAVVTVRSFAAAQDVTPAVDHPAVGAWRWENDRLHPGDPSYAVIQFGGTYVEYYPGHGVGIGTWEATGERSMSLTIVFQDLDPSPVAVQPGLLTYRLAVVANESGGELSATGSVYLQAPDGAVLEERRFDGTAVRVNAAKSGPIPVPAPDEATP